MSRANTIIILALSVMTLLWVVQYVMQFDLNTQGVTLDDMQKQVKVLQDQNMELKAQIYHKEALTTIDQEARAMGFIDEENNIIYIK